MEKLFDSFKFDGDSSRSLKYSKSVCVLATCDTKAPASEPLFHFLAFPVAFPAYATMRSDLSCPTPFGSFSL